MCVEVLKTGGLAKAEDLIMDKSISDRVKLVNISGDQVTFVSNIFRDKGVGAEGHSWERARESNPQLQGRDPLLHAQSAREQ